VSGQLADADSIRQLQATNAALREQLAKLNQALQHATVDNGMPNRSHNVNDVIRTVQPTHDRNAELCKKQKKLEHAQAKLDAALRANARLKSELALKFGGERVLALEQDAREKQALLSA
jgi:hypothetical protein